MISPWTKMPLEICNWMFTRIICIYPWRGRIKKLF